MTRPRRLAADAMGMLRHIEVHGPRTRAEVAKGCTGDTSKTLSNLAQLGYVVADHTTRPACYGLTSKARKALGDTQGQPPAAPLPAPTARLAAQPPAAAQPTARAVTPVPAPKPRKLPSPRTMAAVQHLVTRPWAQGSGGTEVRAGDYTGHEIRRPSLRPGSMAAFSLPSRMGDQLHYRDGLVTDMAGNPVPHR